MTTICNQPPEVCPICGAARTVHAASLPFDGEYDGVAIHLARVDAHACEECGETFFSAEQSLALDRAVKSAAAERRGGMSPGRIIELRKRLSLSQRELEDLLGLGPKVVTRWENGRAVPPPTVHVMLRVLSRRPELIEVLRSLRDETP
jgi:putative zinc finger/helix-turn-helix YgiT family protein